MNSVCMLVLPRMAPSLALPARRPLRAEAPPTSARVLGREHRRQDVHLLLPALVLAPIEAAAQDLLGGGGRERAIGGDRGPQLQGAVERSTGLDHPVDQAVAVRGLCGDRI